MVVFFNWVGVPTMELPENGQQLRKLKNGGIANIKNRLSCLLYHPFHNRRIHQLSIAGNGCYPEPVFLH
jgi:hypothetical protein